VKIERLPAARASACRFMSDHDGMRAIGFAIAALASDPYPPDAFHRGDYHRLRAGSYKVTYFVDADLVTVQRVDRAD